MLFNIMVCQKGQSRSEKAHQSCITAASGNLHLLKKNNIKEITYSLLIFLVSSKSCTFDMKVLYLSHHIPALCSRNLNIFYIKISL